METRDLGRLFFHPARVKPGSPRVHKATTREIEEPFRVSRSVVIKVPVISRAGVWLGLRRPWLSLQVKVPVGPKLSYARAAVIGWWRDSHLEEWQALMLAIQPDHPLDGTDESEFTDPEFSGTNADRGIGLITGRRVDDLGDAWVVVE